MKTKHLILILFIIYSLLLIWTIMLKCNLLIGDLYFGFRGITLIPFKNILNGGITFNEILIEILGNILTFIPLGILLGLSIKNKKLIVLIVVGVSLFFEILQYVLAFGSSDITDIIFNTLGGLIGFLIYLFLIRKIKIKTLNVCLIVLIIIGFLISIYAITSTIIQFDKYML